MRQKRAFLTTIERGIVKLPAILLSLQGLCLALPCTAAESLTAPAALPPALPAALPAVARSSNEAAWTLAPAASTLAESTLAESATTGVGPDPAAAQPPLAGPPAPSLLPDPQPSPAREWSDHVPAGQATHRGFLRQVGAIRTETLLFAGYFSLQSGKKLFREHTGFHFNNEGWFGKDTTNLGIDKLTHAYDTYLIAELLHMRLHERTHASAGDALTASILAAGFMALNEISDGIETDSGYSMQDIAMNMAGAGFSLLRNTVPGMREKVGLKIEIIPNGSIYSYRGQRHYEQQRFMLSVHGAGFKPLRHGPLRYVDLQVGYYGSDFLQKDREAGITPKRHLFVGLGLNVGELLFPGPRSGIRAAGYRVLDYLQLPYTSLRYDTTGRLGH